MLKIMKFEPHEKLVEYPLPKRFHHEQPVSIDLRDQMEEVHRDFTKYMTEKYFDDVQAILKEFIDELHPREEKRKSLENNLFWWKILYDSSQEMLLNCTDEFIEENPQRFKDNPLITSWLSEWDNATTRFYYVGYKYSDRAFLVIDSLENKMVNVIIKDSRIASPKEGEIVIGTIIPIGDGLYSPITDFYRFDYGAREAIGGTFRYFYDKFLKGNSLSAAFVHVLSVMLQIERRIHLKIKRVK